MCIRKLKALLCSDSLVSWGPERIKVQQREASYKCAAYIPANNDTNVTHTEKEDDSQILNVGIRHLLDWKSEQRLLLCV